MSFQPPIGVLYSQVHLKHCLFQFIHWNSTNFPSKYELSLDSVHAWCYHYFGMWAFFWVSTCWNSRCVSWSAALPFNYVLSLPLFLSITVPHLLLLFWPHFFFVAAKQAGRIEHPTPSHDASPFASFNPFHPVGVWKWLGWVFLHNTWGLNLS